MELFHQVEGDGAAVVLVHAGICDSRMWDDQWPAFTAAHRVVRLDLRGFGRTPQGDQTYSSAGDVIALLDRLGIERAALVGVSMGGRVTLEVAIARPGLATALVLVGSGLPGHDWSPTVQAYGTAEDAAIERGDVEEACELNLRMWVDGPDRTPAQVDPLVRERVRAMQRRAFELQLGEDDREQLLVDDPAGRAAELRLPALVAVGEHDVSDMHEIGDLLASRIAGARRVTIEGAAHLPNMEQPAAFDRLVLGFLAEHAG
jgi:3-oxoadipate enol-lactonase